MVSQPSSGQIDYNVGLKQLQDMFPHIELEIIKDVLENNNFKVEISINHLLQISENMYQFSEKNDKEISKEKKTQGGGISILGNNEQSQIENYYKNRNNPENQKEKEIKKVVSGATTQNNKTQITSSTNSNSIKSMQKVEGGTQKKKTIGEKMKNWVGNIFKPKKVVDRVAKTETNNIKNTEKDEYDDYMKLSNKEED